MKRSDKLRLESLILNAASICHDFGDSFCDVARHEARHSKRAVILHELQRVVDDFDSKLAKARMRINEFAGSIEEAI